MIVIDAIILAYNVHSTVHCNTNDHFLSTKSACGRNADAFKGSLGLNVFAFFLPLSESDLTDFSAEGDRFVEHGFQLGFHRLNVCCQLIKRGRFFDGFMVLGESLRGRHGVNGGVFVHDGFFLV